MIVTRLHAENVLKYAKLELDHLPEDGLIAVSGQNESGKSTISETICFALFGRTYSLKPDVPAKLIRWGEPRCSVALEFKTKDDKGYRISRYLDSEGMQGARLSILYADSEQTIARGAEHVDAAIAELIGFNYDEFVESFYLAQRELTAPHPHSRAVMVMAGIAPLARVSDDLQTANDAEATHLGAMSDQIADAESKLTALNIDETRLGDLEDTRQAVATAQTDRSERADELNRTAGQYQEHRAEARSARRRRRFGRLVALVFFLAAAALWAGWALLLRLPEHPLTGQLSAWLAANLPQLQPGYEPYLLPGAVAATALFLLTLFGARGTASRVKQLNQHARALADQLGLALESGRADTTALMTKAAALVPDPHAPQRTVAADPVQTADPAEIELPPGIDELQGNASKFRAEPAAVTEAVEAIGRVLLKQSMDMKQQIARLDPAIEVERDRCREAKGLQNFLAGYQTKYKQKAHEVRVRDVAVGLLDGASREMSHRFNHGVRSLTGRALPLFTEGRYEHLHIDDDLTVRVFSTEKHDFMEFDEISSGTQRQIMLALRLALSQELLRTTVAGAQFVFLDEPFAFFDRERMLATLHALPQISDELAQIWIIAQELPAEARVDMHIQCARDSATLSAPA